MGNNIQSQASKNRLDYQASKNVPSLSQNPSFKWMEESDEKQTQLMKMKDQFIITLDEAKRLFEECDYNIQLYFSILQERISKMYFDMGKISFNYLNNLQMNEEQIIIFISQQILGSSLNILKAIGEKIQLEQSESILKRYNQLQISIIKYMKLLYPRGQSNFVPLEIMNEFKEIDMIEQPQFDILQSKKIYFSSNHPLHIAQTLKKMINSLIDETQNFYDQFHRLIHDEICVLHEDQKTKYLPFTCMRLLSETVSRLDQNNGELNEIENLQILKLLNQWIKDIKDNLQDPSEEIIEKDYYKFLVDEEKKEFTYISPQEIQNLIFILKEILIKQGQQYQLQIEDLNRDLQKFTWILIKILNSTERQQNYILKEQAELMKFAKYIGEFQRWKTLEKLRNILGKLIEAGQRLGKQGMMMKGDLIKFNVVDLLQGQVYGEKRQIFEIFKNMKRLEKDDKIKIVKISNNLETHLNQAKVIFKLKSSVLFCQLSLFIKQKTNMETKIKNIEFLNIFFNELQVSDHGVLQELSMALIKRDKRLDYEPNITFFPIHIAFENCQHSHPSQFHVIKHQKKPFVCSACAKFYQTHSNFCKYYHCTKCFYFICYSCIYKNDKEKIQRQCLVLIRELIDEQLRRLTVEQKQYLKNVSFNELRSEINYTAKSFGDNIWSFFKPTKNLGQNFIFIKAQKNQSSVKKEVIEKMISDMLKNKSGDYFGTLGAFKQGKLVLHSFTFSKKKIQFNFEESLNTASIRCGDNDFIIIHDFQKYKDHEIQFSSINSLRKVYLYEKSRKDDQRLGFTYTFEQTGQFHLILASDKKAHEQSMNKMTIWEIRNHLPIIKETRSIYDLHEEQLGDSHLTYFELVSWKSEVRDLNLAHNYLKDISVLLKNLVNLQKLNVPYNHIEQIIFSKKLDKLMKINCSNNRLSEFTGLENVKNINHINCGVNYLQQFPKTSLNQLRFLKLTGNNLMKFQDITPKLYPEIAQLYLNFDSSSNQMNSMEISCPKLRIIELKGLNTKLITLKNTHNLEILDLQHIQANTLITYQLDRLKKCRLFYLNITNLDVVLNMNFTSLTKLHIQYSKIKKLPIMNVPRLKEFHMMSTGIEDIMNLQNSEISSLKILTLQKNRISSIPVFNAQNLQQFIIQNSYASNSYDVIPINSWGFMPMPQLKHLQINDFSSECKIKFEQLPLLKNLSITGGQLENFSKQYKSVVDLNLTNLQGDNFPIIDCQKLKHLYLSGCSFKNPVNLTLLKAQQLEVLSIQHCLNTPFKLPLIDISNVRTIYLTENCITDVSSFEKIEYSQLQELDLSNNEICEIPKFRAPKLNDLTMSGNCLKSSIKLESCDLGGLQYLILSQNPELNTLPPLNFALLKQLDISLCAFQNIQWLNSSNLPTIQYIELSGNPIQDPMITKQITLPSLYELSLDESNLKTLNHLQFLYMGAICTINLHSLKESIKSFPKIHMPILNHLTINDSWIEDISGLSYSDVPQLETIEFIDTSITTLPNLSFSKLKYLTVKTTNQDQDSGSIKNKLKDISNLSSSSLPLLQKIIIEHTAIEKLPFMDFPKLQKIFITNNAINDTSDFLKSRLPALSLINIYDNPINHLPIGRDLKPSEIYVKGGKVMDFKTLAKFSSQIEKLHYNQSTLPSEVPFLSFPQANRVQFQSCNLVNIDNFLKYPYQQAEEISFVGNSITSVPPLIANKLKRLFLNKNKIKDIKAFMQKSQLPEIDLISFEYNEIDNLCDFPFENIREAFISRNYYTDISFMQKYTYRNMVLLVASQNNICKLGKLDCPVLGRIFLNVNQIEDLSALEGSFLPCLTLLQLCKNKIKSFDVFQRIKLPAIQRIQLQYNNCKSVCSFSSLSSLNHLTVKNNPIIDISRLTNIKQKSKMALYITFSQSLSSEETRALEDKVEEKYQFAYIG